MIVTLATNPNSFKKNKNHYESFFITSVCFLAEFLHYHDKKNPMQIGQRLFFWGKKNAKSHHILRKKNSHWPLSTHKEIYPHFYKTKILLKSFYILTTCCEQCVENMAIFLEMSFDF
jgi:hypothetical protein